MLPFIYDILPSRVIFGVGSLNSLPEELDRLGTPRALILSTPEQKHLAADVAARLGDRAAGVFDRAAMHVPIATAQAARDEAIRLSAGCCIAIGGGSTTGLGKAIALVSGLPIIAIPTTYAGSEMTPIWGITEDGVKKTGRDPRVLPKTVIYDPRLTLTIPAQLTATSGMNAIAHCVEALYAKDANPIISLCAEEGIRALSRSLPIAVREPQNLDARTDALYGAWLAGIALGSVGMALHHKLCHTLGGTFNLPHAETHTVVLPYAAAYNSAAAPEAMRRIAAALNAPAAPAGLSGPAPSAGASSTPARFSALAPSATASSLPAGLSALAPSVGASRTPAGLSAPAPSVGASGAPGGLSALAPSTGAPSAHAGLSAPAPSVGASRTPAGISALAPSAGASGASAGLAPSAGASSTPAGISALAPSAGAPSAPASLSDLAPSAGASSLPAGLSALAPSTGAPSAPAGLSDLAPSAGASSAPAGLFALAQSLGAPTSLASLGMKETDLDRAADLAVQNPYYNPAPVTRDGILALLQRAFHGTRVI